MKGSCKSCTVAASLQGSLYFAFNTNWISPPVPPAGAQSSGQSETAGVYELQGQAVRDAPQEVSSSSNSN